MTDPTPPQIAESGEPNYRLWWEQSERRRAEVERVLDGVLGTEEDDGAGAGLVADVVMALAVAWDQGAQARAQADPATSVQNLNPYRTSPGSGSGGDPS